MSAIDATRATSIPRWGFLVIANGVIGGLLLQPHLVMRDSSFDQITVLKPKPGRIAGTCFPAVEDKGKTGC